jgi:MYXO-CTERM domain-containing protein
MPRSSLCSILAALLIALAPGAASAYCLLKTSGAGSYVKWKNMPVTYRVSNSVTDPKILAAIDKAFQTWQAVSCSTLTFKKGTPFTMCTTASCAAGTIKFLHATPNIHVYWYKSAQGYPTNTNYAAYMYLWHDTFGSLVGGSIAVNAFNTTWATNGSAAAIDVQNEMTSFIGSVVGLTDSKVLGASMYPGISYGDTSKRSLHLDDVNGLVYLYQQAGCAAPPAPGATGCSAAPPVDAGVPDSAAADAGPSDSAAPDAPPPDATVALDSAALDTAASDSAPQPDAAPVDGPATDTAASEGGVGDAGGSGDAVAGADSGGGNDAGVGGDTNSSGDAAMWDLSGSSDAAPYLPPPSAGGCDCGVTGPAPSGALWLALGLLCLLVLRRRR